MINDQQDWNSTYSGTVTEPLNYTHHHSDENHSVNQLQNEGRSVMYKFKSSHFMKPSTNNRLIRLESLTHCQKCSLPFRRPVTLSCGYTLCYECVPESSQCLSFSCLRTHKLVDCKPTILIETILAQFTPTVEFNQTLKNSLDCSICLSTLNEPITTKCGHTFCRECLIRTMTDMNSRSCPFCRTEIDRIGKVNQLIFSWLDYLNNSAYYYSDESNSDEEEQMSQLQHIPIIRVTGAVAFPDQPCLFHIIHDKFSLLKHMIHKSHQKHYAICVFSTAENQSYEHGVMLRIDHVEHSPDIRHSVVQATGLFRLRISQLAIDVDDCYTGEVTRLDDRLDGPTNLEEEESSSKRWDIPRTSITRSTPSTPTRSTHEYFPPAPKKNVRPRPCSMRLSSSAPNSSVVPQTIDNYVGTRRAWGTLMNKPPSPPPYFLSAASKKPKVLSLSPSSSTTTTKSINEIFDQELHPYIIQYLTTTGNSIWMMQYDWYLQHSDRNTLIWWIANILPLQYDEKMALLASESLRGRIMALITWRHKW